MPHEGRRLVQSMINLNLLRGAYVISLCIYHYPTSRRIAWADRAANFFVEETMTVHRLGIGAVLRRKLATTNPIESCLSTVQRVARNVKRWREGNQPLRWTATGLLEAEKKFRRIKGFQELLLLKERLNPSGIQQKEVRTVDVA